MISNIRASFVAALVIAASFTAAKADSAGTLGLVDIGTPTVGGGNIDTATVFNIGNLFTTGSATGVFAGLANQTLGPVSFDTTNPTSLTFGNSTMGTFTSTSITQIANVTGQVSYYIAGNFVGGSYTGTLTPNPAPASFQINFSQVGGPGTAITDSSTLSIPPSPNSVPEPSSIMLVGLGVVSMGVVARRKKAAIVA